jgi:hypothetical protein
VSQSSAVAFYLIAGFIIFITMKGELADYAALLGFGPGNRQ